MTPIPLHLNWLKDSKKAVQTKDGVQIAIWELNHVPDAKILSAWGRHFRNHYCDDKQIDLLRMGTPHSRAQYLKELKFPDASVAPGPSIRSGDFAEVLIADYVEFLLGYWVPRTRYDDKTIRNESKKGSDVIGFRFQRADKSSPLDTLLIFESKAQLSGKKAASIMQEAIDHSAKDELRKAESLNAVKQRLLDRKELECADRVARFQNQEDRPYKSLYGAAAIFTSEILNETVLKTTDASGHLHKPQLSLLVISGPKLMDLVNQLYDLAAREA
jgi:Cap4 SAVED domain